RDQRLRLPESQGGAALRARLRGSGWRRDSLSGQLEHRAAQESRLLQLQGRKHPSFRGVPRRRLAFPPYVRPPLSHPGTADALHRSAIRAQRSRAPQEVTAMSRPFLITSETVTESHQDKVADQVSDMVLNAFLTDHPNGGVAFVTFV